MPIDVGTEVASPRRDGGASPSGHSRRHRYGRHLHGPRRRRRVDRGVVHRQGSVDSGATGGGARGNSRAGAVRPRRRLVHRDRYDDRDQRGSDPHRRARPLPHHEGVRGRAAHPADQPQEPLRLRLAEAHAARAAAGLPRRRRAARLRGSGGASPPARPGRGAAARAWRRGRRRRGLLPLLLSQSQLRARGPRCHRRARSRPSRLALARDRSDLARVRARDGGHPRRLPEADARPLRGGRGRGVPRTGIRVQLVPAEVERRPRRLVRGARASGARPALGGRRRGDRRCLLRPGARRRARDRPRHGRHELRRLPDRRRHPAVLLRVRDRVRPPGRRPDRQYQHDRRRGRLDRVDRPRRLPPGRPPERGRRARPGVLRQGRRATPPSPTRTSSSEG